MFGNISLKNTYHITNYTTMILEDEKSKFLHILTIVNNLNSENGKLFTQAELSTHLKVSLKKINSFVNGEIFDFWLLCRYCNLFGIELEFDYKF